MERYDPERRELSTRDRVALAGFTEIAEGRGTEKGGVYLDVSHLPRERILQPLKMTSNVRLDDLISAVENTHDDALGRVSGAVLVLAMLVWAKRHHWW